MEKWVSLASEEVTVQLMKTKCLPVLYYAVEACPINKSQIKALDYVLFSSFTDTDSFIRIRKAKVNII